MCSQTEITGSGWTFERTTVWTMVWRWSDQRLCWSDKSEPRSGDGLKQIIRHARKRIRDAPFIVFLYCCLTVVENLIEVLERFLNWSEAALSECHRAESIGVFSSGEAFWTPPSVRGSKKEINKINCITYQKVSHTQYLTSGANQS